MSVRIKAMAAYQLSPAPSVDMYSTVVVRLQFGSTPMFIATTETGVRHAFTFDTTEMQKLARALHECTLPGARSDPRWD